MTVKRAPWKAWTEEESEKLWQLCIERSSRSRLGLVTVGREHWEHISSQLSGRTIYACRERFGTMKAHKEGRCPIRQKARKANPHYVMRTPEDIAIRQNPIALPDHLTITAFVLGDPLPGRSALDQKRASAV